MHEKTRNSGAYDTDTASFMSVWKTVVNSQVLLSVLGYDCGVNNPCTSMNEGSYLPHVNPSTYIVCGTATQCTEMPCPVNTIWDQRVFACVRVTT